MSETGLYQKQLREMYDLRGNGEGAVLSYIKRNFITFEKGNTLNNESIVAFFADYGFDKVLREMASREMDFYAAKEVGSLEKMGKTVLDQYLMEAKWYDKDCLDLILSVGSYKSCDMARSFMNICEIQQQIVRTNASKIAGLNMHAVVDSFLENGLDLDEEVDGRLPFHSLCALYSDAKKQNVSPVYQKMLAACVQRCLDADVDLNAVDSKNRTAFSVNDIEMKSRFVRYQKLKEEKRLLDLFMVVDQLIQGGVTVESADLLKTHIVSLKKDISNYAKRARFDDEYQR